MARGRRAQPSARPFTVRRVRAQPKVRFICECFVPHFVPHFVGECESQVCIWWDFLSRTHAHTRCDAGMC